MEIKRKIDYKWDWYIQVYKYLNFEGIGKAKTQ